MLKPATKRHVAVGLWTLLVVALLTGVGLIGSVFYLWDSLSHGGRC